MANTEMNYVDNGGDIQVGVEQPIGTFFDGTNTYIRYRKVIDFGALPNAATKNVPHGITSLDPNKVLSLTGIGRKSSDSYPFPYYVNSNFTAVAINATNITIITSNNVSTYTALVTIEYYR